MYVKFKRGALKVEIHGNALIVGDRIVLDARSITFPKGSKVYQGEPDKKRRVLVIEHEELKLEEFPPTVDMVSGERRYFHGFELRAADLDFEKYLTVVVPGSFLYDYAIITPSKTEIVMSAKRNAYLEETSKASIIYLL
ncbi:hypothetical protein IPA_01005 [Ignicoccus pacificus DSM 13166]|uniref:Uncharacterized protein n=1 Tax=Ignicoccus pacificus DSM 13166 TaxID=940294 RepID=A0A977KBW5_9CREN|nr:hypothetical protein IPA_01005 [Ignicoccus pacificus DSM 13166]